VDSGYSGQKYGQVCGQTTYFPIGLMRNRGRKVIVLQHGSANIARGLADISADTNGKYIGSSGGHGTEFTVQ